MGGIYIEEDLLVKYSIVDSKLPEGQRIHNALLARAKALAGRYIDFDKTPVTFLLSDSDGPNALFAPAFDPQNKPRCEDGETVRYIKNPIPTPVICITRGLLEMVDNQDQLDVVLSHELTHMMMRGFGIQHNSKGEEGIADLHAVDLVYDAGGDPKQALIMSEKISAYAKAEKEKGEMSERKSRRKREEKGVDWSSILDVHMSDKNRKAGIEASLTRLSHLIDERQPTAIDKEVFSAHYNDPIDEFLDDHNYKKRTPLGKLKLLVDCIDHLSAPVSPEEYFQDQVVWLGREFSDPDTLAQEQERKIQAYTAANRDRYYKGPVVRKKYQQKIAYLAESIIDEVESEREKKGKRLGPVEVNAIDLNVYLQNRAYQHITRHGYPEVGDLNYFEASGILYSYFFTLFRMNSRRWDQKRDRKASAKSCPRIEIDIEESKAKVRSAKSAEEFRVAVDDFRRLRGMLRDMRDSLYGYNNSGDKFNNLTDIGRLSFRDSIRETPIYGELEVGRIVPWNNLVAIAKVDAETKDYIVKFLSENGIEDLRITHNLPYICIEENKHYAVDAEGRVSREGVPDYEVSFAKDRDVVLAAYDYIESYFDAEVGLIEKTCLEAASINDQDFKVDETLSEKFGRVTVAQKITHDFVAMFNALPENQEEERVFGADQDSLSLIPGGFRREHRIPGSDEDGRLEINHKLFRFNNPIFQERFGEGYREKLVARKNAQQKKMFETAVVILEKSVDLWLEAAPKYEVLKERVTALQRDVLGTPREEKEVRAAKQESLNDLQKEYEFYSSKKELAETLVFNFLSGVLGKDRSWHHLRRLTDEQNHAFAEFAVRDEKGAILQIFGANRYEQFCDRLGILEEQTACVISGNYALTEAMQAVADKYWFCRSVTADDLNDFVRKGESEKESRYVWYLHIFDTIRYLENSSNINIQSLLFSLTKIFEDRARYDSEPDPTATARYENYKKLVTESALIPLVSKAVSCQANYESLSFRDSLAAADLMISVFDQMEPLLVKRTPSKDYSRAADISVEPEHQEFFDLLGGQIKSLLRRSETLALEEGNALEKMVKLFNLYKYREKYSSSSQTRRAYLDKLIEEENRLNKLSAMSEDPFFWPEDVLEHVKAFVFAKNTFIDDKEVENKLLNDLLDKLERTPLGRKKSESLYILLDKNMRAAYPETRDRLFDIYAGDVSERLGKDDGSSGYQRRLSVYLKTLDDSRRKKWDVAATEKSGLYGTMLSNSIAVADKYLLLRRVSDLIVSQEQTSQMLKRSCQVSLNSDDMLYSYLYGIGVDYLTERMDKDSDMANRFIRFLNSKGEREDCEEISKYIESVVRAEARHRRHRPEEISQILKKVDSGSCKILYENFWSAPLEARAVIIARILKSVVNSEDDTQAEPLRSWELVFDIVMDNIIHPDDSSVEAKCARDIMHSYIKSRSDYERELILSAMMVANRNIGADIGNVGKALKLFLENMGPAEIKLGQAIASHPDTPEGIRKELQQLKGAAYMPARWTVYDWIKAEKIPEEFWKNKYLGEIMGGASYYVTVALGEEEALRMLRPEAREKATKGFRVIESTVEDLKRKEGQSEFSYQELTRSVQEMVVQAARMSEIETDHDRGQRQYEFAKDIYDGVTIRGGQETFSLKVMDWKVKGQNWIIMDRAKGQTYNALPEDTPEQIAYKKHFARSYILFEMTNILSGRKFDHDRHGAQLSVDTATNKVGIYDTGAMALQDPAPEAQRTLGGIIYDVFKAAMSGQDAVSSFGLITGEKIEELHNQGQDTQYLVEVKKGILALGDFFKILDRDDIRGILLDINIAEDLSQDVQSGITKGMSFLESAQWQGLLAVQSAQRRADLIIRRGELNAQDPIDVSTVVGCPQKAFKASWLQDTFGKGDDENGAVRTDSSGFSHRVSRYSERPARVF